MKRKKLIFRSFATLVLSTVLATGAPALMMPGLKTLPIISDTSITAEAASKCYTIENGTMTLMNKVSATTIKELKNKEQITKIVALDGTVLPANCSELFHYYKNVTSIDLSKANTSNVTNMKEMFYNLRKLVDLNISGFDTSNVTNMRGMFQYCNEVTQIDVSSFDTSKVTDMSAMFWECGKITKLDLSHFNTKKVTDMHMMFDGCWSITRLDLGSFNTGKVTDMNGLFKGMQKLEDLNISSFNTSNVTNMSSMFANCSSLRKLDLTNFDTRKVTAMGEMFEGLEMDTVDVSGFKTSNVTSMNYMFANCHFKSLDLSNFNATNATKGYMFSLAQINKITLGPKFKKIPAKADLSNGSYGWAMGSPDSERISGDDQAAVIINNGTNTYYKIAKFEDISIEMVCGDYPRSQTYPQYQARIDLFLQLGDVWGPDGHRIEGNYIPFTMKYTWYRDKNVIPNATGRSYVCTKEDIGKVISCTITDADGIYKGEAKISTEVPIRKAKGPLPPKGLNGYDCSEMGANDGKITGVDKTMEYATDYKFTNAIACTSGTILNLKPGTYYIRYKETDTHDPGSYTTVTVQDGPKVLKGNVTITGTLKYGQPLTAKVSDSNVSEFSYQWKRGSSAISGATASTYKLVKEDIGQVISCEVTDATRSIQGSISAKTSAKIDKADGPTAPSGLKGIAPSKKGGSDGKITGVKTTMEYATKTDFSDKKACASTTIIGLKAGTYYVRVAETATTKAGASAKVTVADGKAVISGKVAISGTLKYGQTLTAKVSDSNATKFTYQWKRGSSAISGATASTYKLVKADIGQVISCVVKDASGNTIGSLSAKTSAKIAKADGPAAPTGLNGVAPTKKDGSDGQIVGVKTTMEYSTKSDFSANVEACTSTTIKNLKAGTYYVRIKETDVRKVGKTAKVVVPATADPTDNKNGVTKIFKDVKAGEWYVNAIQFVYDRKYMNGVSSNLFGTNTAITREQFVTVLYNIEGQPSVKYRKVFKDVADKQFYSKAVIWAYDNKITKGISDTVFGTGNNISREQLSTMLYNYSQYKKFKSVAKNKDLSTFPDYKKVSSWAKEGMTWAVSNGVVNGKAVNGKNYLDPTGKATRAECAQMVKNLFDKVIKK